MVTNLQIDKKNIKRETEIKTVIPISFYEEAFTLFIEDCAFFDSSMLGTKRVKIYFEKNFDCSLSKKIGNVLLEAIDEKSESQNVFESLITICLCICSIYQVNAKIQTYILEDAISIMIC